MTSHLDAVRSTPLSHAYDYVMHLTCDDTIMLKRPTRIIQPMSAAVVTSIIPMLSHDVATRTRTLKQSTLFRHYGDRLIRCTFECQESSKTIPKAQRQRVRHAYGAIRAYQQGLCIAGRWHRPIAYKMSGGRMCDYWLALSGDDIATPLTLHTFYASMGDYSTIERVGKFISRIALVTSDSIPTIRLQQHIHHVRVEHDIRSSRDAYPDAHPWDSAYVDMPMTDGCGRISADLATQMCTIADTPDASVFQIRCLCWLGMFKGLLQTDRKLAPNTIIFTRSMCKHGPPVLHHTAATLDVTVDLLVTNTKTKLRKNGSGKHREDKYKIA